MLAAFKHTRENKGGYFLQNNLSKLYFIHSVGNHPENRTTFVISDRISRRREWLCT